MKSMPASAFCFFGLNEKFLTPKSYSSLLYRLTFEQAGKHGILLIRTKLHCMKSAYTNSVHGIISEIAHKKTGISRSGHSIVN